MQDTEKEQKKFFKKLMGGSDKHGELTILKNNVHCIYMHRQNIAETSVILLTSGDEGPIGETMKKYLVDA